MAFLYILRCRNNRFYIGSTTDLERRLAEHRAGKTKYLSILLPVEVVFKQEYRELKIAREAELWLKKQKSSNLIRQIIEEGMIKKSFETSVG